MSRGLRLGTDESGNDFCLDAAQILDVQSRSMVVVVSGDVDWVLGLLTTLPRAVTYDDGTPPVPIVVVADASDWSRSGLLVRASRQFRRLVLLAQTSTCAVTQTEKFRRGGYVDFELRLAEEYRAIFTDFKKPVTTKWVNLTAPAG